MPDLSEAEFPRHAYRNGTRLWSSKLILLPEFWSRDRQRKTAIEMGEQRIANGVISKYGEERPLLDMELVPLKGNFRGRSGFVLTGYVRCDYEECPEHLVITPESLAKSDDGIELLS